MIDRDHGESAKRKFEEIKNRLIQLGLFVEMDPFFAAMNKQMENIQNGTCSTSGGTSSSSSDSGSSSSSSGGGSGTIAVATENFDSTRKQILQSLKGQIEVLLNSAENDIRGHL